MFAAAICFRQRSANSHPSLRRSDIALNAPDAGDFWVADSPSRVSGPLQSQAQIEWKQEVASGQLWLAGSNLRMRDLVLRQISAQCSISNSDVYVNDFSASLNNTDYVNATGTFNLRPPHHYSGKASANVSNLAVFEPLLRAFGNQSQLAGSFKLDWEGSGQGMTASPASARLARSLSLLGTPATSSSFWKKRATEICKGSRRTSTRHIRPTVLMCRPFFSRRATWISMRSLGPRVTRWR